MHLIPSPFEQVWKERHNDVTSPLVEICIGPTGSTCISKPEIERFLTVFGCDPLRKLSLYPIFDWDTSCLERIVGIFPQLEEFTLFISAVREPWPGELVRRPVRCC
jgi:hypothetical protein